LPEAAKTAGAPVVTIGPITKDGRTAQGQQLQLPPEVMTAAFQLPAGGESELMDVGQGEYFAVRVEKIQPAALPPLAEVKSQLTNVWMSREIVKRMQARADQFAERLKKGESLEAVAAAAGAKVGHATNLDRATAGQNTALSRDALVKAFGAGPGEVFTAQATQFALIVGKLEAVRPPEPASIARMVEDARPQLTLNMFQEIGESARQAARKEVKVKVNPNRARAALGLEPLASEGDGKAGPAKTAEKGA
jgi:peptidyl-prolyl cis-trans isomerase D